MFELLPSWLGLFHLHIANKMREWGMSMSCIPFCNSHMHCVAFFVYSQVNPNSIFYFAETRQKN